MGHIFAASGRTFAVSGRIVLLSVISLALPLFASAQARGGAAGGGHASAGSAGHVAAAPHVSAAPHYQASAGNRSASVRTGSSTARRRTGNSGRRFNGSFDSGSVDFSNVPGLGFDYPHLAAVNGNRRLRGSRFNGGFPFGFSGFLLTPPVIVEEAQPAESQAEEDPYAETAPVQPERRSRARLSASAAAPEPAAQPAPQPDAEQYVFVRRDGSLVFAVAYSWDNGTLRYVTPEGFRRTITSDALDLTATQQFNEQRGLNFRSPA